MQYALLEIAELPRRHASTGHPIHGRASEELDVRTSAPPSQHAQCRGPHCGDACTQKHEAGAQAGLVATAGAQGVVEGPRAGVDGVPAEAAVVQARVKRVINVTEHLDGLHAGRWYEGWQVSTAARTWRGHRPRRLGTSCCRTGHFGICTTCTCTVCGSCIAGGSGCGTTAVLAIRRQRRSDADADLIRCRGTSTRACTKATMVSHVCRTNTPTRAVRTAGNCGTSAPPCVDWTPNPRPSQ